MYHVAFLHGDRNIPLALSPPTSQPMSHVASLDEDENQTLALSPPTSLPISHVASLDGAGKAHASRVLLT